MAAILSQAQCITPPDVETTIFWITRTIQDKQVLVFPEERFQLPVSSQLMRLDIKCKYQVHS